MTRPIKRPPPEMARGRKVLIIKAGDEVVDLYAGDIGRLTDRFDDIKAFGVRFLTGALRGREYMVKRKSLKRIK
jgi:hypothetical protein